MGAGACALAKDKTTAIVPKASRACSFRAGQQDCASPKERPTRTCKGKRKPQRPMIYTACGTTRPLAKTSPTGRQSEVVSAGHEHRPNP
eukprot:4194030-Amphidinium_carterae.3